jgi:adenylate cyclase
MTNKGAFLRGRIRLNIGIGSIFVAVVVALTTGIIWNNYRQASSVALTTADQLFYEVTTKVDERMNGMLNAVKATVDAASAMPSLSGKPRYDGLSHPALETMIRMFEAQPNVFSVFAGFASGEWIQVSATRGNPDVAAAFHVPDGTDFIVRTITQDRTGKRREYLRYLDRNRHVVGARTEIDPAYDPRGRSWYTSALASERTIFSDPFIFFALQKPGITASRRLIGGGGVVAVAVTLSNFSQFLSEQSTSPNMEAFLFNSKGEILVHQDPSFTVPVVQKSGTGRSGQAILRKADEIDDPIVQALVRESLASEPNPSAMKRLQAEGQTYLVGVKSVGVQLGLDQYIAIVAPLADFTQHITRMQQHSIVTALLALAIALPLIFLIARRISAKLATLSAEADRIRRFDLDSPVEVESLFVEVNNLSRAFSSMRQAVGVFGRYVPKALVREIVQSGTPPERGGHRQAITVMFTDISDFTRIAEGTEPEELMLRTSEYFEVLGAVLSHHHGVVDKYIGDAIMALWNAPNRDDDHIAHACMAALACRDASRALAINWTKQAIPTFETRFGLHCGEAVVGNVGGADRINFTAVGATINLASRLEALNKIYKTDILVSEDVAVQVDQQFLLRRIDRV